MFETMMRTVLSVLVATVRAGTPLLFAAQGEIIAERSGIINLGVEGMMLMGAIMGFIGSRLTGSAWLGVLIAVASGAAVSLIHAFLTISLEARQIVSGLGVGFLGTGLSAIVGQGYIGATVPQISAAPLGVLSRIPFLGEIFFSHNPLVYLSFLLVPAAWLAMFRMKMGMKVRAVGEDPAAAAASGINVARVRYLCVLAGGGLAGLAGAYMSLAYTPMWIQNMTAGRGWIAVSLVVFAHWDPKNALLGAYLFGGFSALQFAIQAQGGKVSAHLLQMMPYLFTILALVLAMLRIKIKGRTSRIVVTGPRSLGRPYSREDKV